MSSNQNAIEAVNLGKRYRLQGRQLAPNGWSRLQRLWGTLCGHAQKSARDEFWALRDVTFAVGKGEAFGIIGRNGSGKSTLLQIIAGTLQPTEGTVTVHGRVTALLELGSGFHPDFTGRENVYINAMLIGLSREETDLHFDEIAAFADIGRHLDEPIKTYSSGMLMRLAFAVQSQVSPDVLIIDEALAVGDALFQRRCYRHLEKLRTDGVTILFVSHDQEVVRTLTNKALVLEGGRMHTYGSSSDALLAYRKILHKEEERHFGELLSDAQTQARVAPSPSLHSVEESFGDGGIKLASIRVLNDCDQPTSVFYPGERICIELVCSTATALSRLNAAVRIRNKEGVKVYSWGTLNQDIERMSAGHTTNIFWQASFNAGDTFTVRLQCDCRLGPNLYEIQVGITREETPNYLSQRILFWKDAAAFFQTQMRHDQYFFGGLCDLEMEAYWSVASNGENASDVPKSIAPSVSPRT